MVGERVEGGREGGEKWREGEKEFVRKSLYLSPPSTLVTTASSN